MFRRFLGTIFLYFYILPAISHGVRKIVIPAMSTTLRKMAEEEMKKTKKDPKLDVDIDSTSERDPSPQQR